MKHRIPPINVTRARRMRAEPTAAENRLWWLLRDRLPWAKFRRQVPINSYIADFACLEARLIVELDGEQHGLKQGLTRDAERDAVLHEEGYTVLRLWNNDLLTNGDAAIETVRGMLEAKGVSTPQVGEAAGRGFRGRGRRATPPRSG